MLAIAQIEAAIVAALRADATLAAIAPTIESHAGKAAMMRARGATIRLPAVLVWYKGGPIEPMGANAFRAELTFGVSLAARSLRSDEARLAGLGSAAEPGIYELATSVLRILAGQTLEQPISELVPLEVEPVQADFEAGEVEYEITFKTRAVFPRWNPAEDLVAASLVVGGQPSDTISFEEES